MFSTTSMKIVKSECVHTYIIMPLSKSAYTVFDRDTLMDTFNAEPRENDSDMADYAAAVAGIKTDGGQDWTWSFENPDKEKPAEFTGSLKGCIKDMVQRLDKENGQDNHYTVIARMYNMMEPDKLQTVVAAAQAYPAAEFLNRQGIELETSAQRFLSENMDANWRLTDERFNTVYFVVNDADPERPVDRAAEYEKQEEAVRNMIQKLNVKCWNVSVERGYIEGVQLVVKNRLFSDFDGDAIKAVKTIFNDKYPTVCRALATIANRNEEDIMDKMGVSRNRINAVFSLMGFDQLHVGYNTDEPGRDDIWFKIPEDREADEIALDELDDWEDHFYEVIWDCLAERDAERIETSLINPLVSTGWKTSGGEDGNGGLIDEDAAEVSADTVKALAPQKPASASAKDDGKSGPNRLLFGGLDDNRNWNKLQWQSAMGIGQRTANSIEISERMFGGTELNYLVKDGTDPYKFYETRTAWKAHPLAAIAYDMDFAAQYVNDYMEKAGIRPGQVEGGEYGTLLFTSTFTNGSRLFADDQGRVFLNLAFGEEDEYPEDISTNNATLLSWCTGMFDPQNNPKASQFYTNLRNYLQVAMNRWADVCSTVKMAGVGEDSVLERFTTLMENFPERKSNVDLIVSKFNNYIFKAYNPMENLNMCIDNLSKGNVTVI